MGIQLSQLRVRVCGDSRERRLAAIASRRAILETWRFLTVGSTTREWRSQFKASFGGVVWGQQAAANT